MEATMYKICSSKLAEWLIEKQAIQPDEKELYSYAVETIFISSIPILLMVVIGGFFGIMKETILIVLPFVIVRKYTGGYHAKCYRKCFIISCCILGICMYSVLYIKANSFFHFLLICAIISISLLSPMDSEAKLLDEDEKKKYKKKAIGYVIAIVCVYIVLLLCNMNRFAIPIAVGVILSSTLQIPCAFLFLIESLKKK